MMLSEAYKKRLKKLAGVEEDTTLDTVINPVSDIHPLSVNPDGEIPVGDAIVGQQQGIPFSTLDFTVMGEAEKKEDKPKESEIKDPIHLPDLTVGKKELIKYLKDLYDIELKD